MPEVRFRVRRYDPVSKGEPRWADFTVPYRGSLSVLDGLFYIQEELDGSLAFRYSCRAAVCGSCAMYINGAYRLACRTNVSQLSGDMVVIAALPHLPLVKDLVCDMTDFFAKYEIIKPYLIRNSARPEREIPQSPAERRKLDMPIDCILCGCCYSACPSVWGEDNYLGPAALLKTYRFEVDSRDEANRERLPLFDNERGSYRCHTITNCIEACPKELHPTEAIEWLKRAAFRRRLLRKTK